MGIALSTSEYRQAIETLQRAYMAADRVSSMSDVEAQARLVKTHLSALQVILDNGISSDRLEVFQGYHTLHLGDGNWMQAMDDTWYARRVAANNEIRWVTEAYTREEDAYRGGYGGAPDLAP